MAPDFGEGWISSPIERWIALLLKSGILFWLGGLVAWLYHSDKDWTFVWQELTSNMKPIGILLLIFVLLMVLAMMAGILKRFDIVVIRFLEGYYWSGWRANLLKYLQNIRIAQTETRFQVLAFKYDKGLPPLTSQEQAEYAHLDWQRMLIPLEEAQRMPTRLGNLLRALELHPQEKYGLDIFVCWFRLWLVLPDSVKKEIVIARDNLNTTARIWMWGLLFLVWIPFTVWVVPISAIVMFLAYHWMLQAANIYGQLIESSFDLYRSKLYQELRWPLPKNAAEERKQGEQLTAYLWRGSDSDKPEFINNE
jgi:hypothetical protein